MTHYVLFTIFTHILQFTINHSGISMYIYNINLTIDNELGSVQTNVVKQLKRSHRIAGTKFHGNIYVLF